MGETLSLKKLNESYAGFKSEGDSKILVKGAKKNTLLALADYYNSRL